MNNESSALSVRGLRKAYVSRDGRIVLALSDFSIDLVHGERIAVLGPSGCGKSTVLRILAGLDDDYSGSINWGLSNESDKTRLRSATVFQGDSTLPWKTVDSNIRIALSGLTLDQATRMQRVRHYRALVGLDEFGAAYPHELSGGMRQRVSIARALATEPQVLLMDEPLAALDAQTRIVMQTELNRIWAAANSTVVYVTHDIDEALSLADRLVVLTARPGRIKEIIKVPFGRELGPLERRKSSAFGSLQVSIWRMVAEEVGQTLTTAASAS